MIACVASNASWGLDTQIWDPKKLCPLFSICLSGQPVFPSDLSGSMGDVIGWRSQVYHTEREQPELWSYCYVRAMRLDRPGDRRPIRWDPGGIAFFGTGEENGCAAVCELADDQHKPGRDPVPGTIKAGAEIPLEADAPAWTYSSGASSTKELGHNPRGTRPTISRPHMIVSNGVTAEAPLGSNLRVYAVSQLFLDGKVGYWVTNLSRSNVRVAWNLPLNSSLKAAEFAFMNKGVLLAPGASYRGIADPASQPSDKGVTIVERPSQILVEVGGHPIIAVDLIDLAPRNGDYETPPVEFLQRDSPR
jgi:hypothetical protein